MAAPGDPNLAQFTAGEILLAFFERAAVCASTGSLEPLNPFLASVLTYLPEHTLRQAVVGMLDWILSYTPEDCRDHAGIPRVEQVMHLSAREAADPAVPCIYMILAMMVNRTTTGDDFTELITELVKERDASLGAVFMLLGFTCTMCGPVKPRQPSLPVWLAPAGIPTAWLEPGALTFRVPVD